jgi:hypothetical protein
MGFKQGKMGEVGCKIYARTWGDIRNLAYISESILPSGAANSGRIGEILGAK